ncbi:hypothetical protein [Roseateles sp. BYS87W]|uniref:Uncharacterized protein n=1 Tax=Pelomonas baiyunensis TaxID=3299026 RepID=A0ABW7H4D2_9BURK
MTPPADRLECAPLREIEGDAHNTNDDTKLSTMRRCIAIAIIQLVLCSHAWAETYWLARFSPSNPKRPPTRLKVDPPTHTAVDVTFITIDGDLLIVNDHICHARLTTPDRQSQIKFDNWEEVEDTGGYDKFRNNLITNLKSDPNTWTKTMWMKEIKSAAPNYDGECGLFSGTRKIYFGNDDVIIPQPFHGYYRYIKGPAATFHTTMKEAEQRKILAAEDSRKLAERLPKTPGVAKTK